MDAATGDSNPAPGDLALVLRWAARAAKAPGELLAHLTAPAEDGAGLGAKLEELLKKNGIKVPKVLQISKQR